MLYGGGAIKIVAYVDWEGDFPSLFFSARLINNSYELRVQEIKKRRKRAAKTTEKLGGSLLIFLRARIYIDIKIYLFVQPPRWLL